MEKLDKIISSFESKKLGYLMRKGETDIDIHGFNKKLVADFFVSIGTTKMYVEKYKVKYGLFIDHKLRIFDIEFDFNHVLKYFGKDIFFTGDMNLLNYNKRKKEFDFLRYLLSFRNDKISFMRKNFKYLEENNFYFDSFNKKIFKTKFKSCNDLEQFLNKNIFYLFRYLRFIFLIKLILNKIWFLCRDILMQIKIKNSFAILGYDGSGKSTIIQHLENNFNCSSYYMGLRRFANRYYYKVLNGNNLFKLIRLILVYIDFLILYLRIYTSGLQREFIFFDRHPKLEIYPHTNLATKALNTIFFFYPKPKKYFLLYNTPEVILSRKKERTYSEITFLNDFIQKDLSNDNQTILIKNDTIDETLNIILKNIYA